MAFKSTLLFLESTLIAVSGGFLFYLLHTPLPWVLGPLTFVILWQGFTKRKLFIPDFVRNLGFIILGVYFGLYFTLDTFKAVLPFIIPYIIITSLFIFVCIMLGVLVTRWIKIDKITSVLSCIPGGLPEMAATSDSLRGKTALVVIYQTIRLVTVLFTIPTLMFFFWGNTNVGVLQQESIEVVQVPAIHYLIYIIPVLAALYLRDKIPAGIIIGALGVTALLNISPLELASIPPILMSAGQIAVGASIGKNILFQDLKIGGKYSVIYFLLSLTIIAISISFGIVLGASTSLDVKTAILGMAPGGFFEMVLTAYNIGADPAIVSSLQLVRILIIVLVVPITVKKVFGKTALSNSTVLRS
ncbi:AbrB family transcriptional regulator [Ornithinibacillus halotolerans]|uniref:Aminopeptidase n=1 Tax=Ornithinibacillus halotolerans TaxID=1274357 RepID=A0A916S349_9BACI|nr:AbrB family transcriptional regulator [Ornithinibacillus halotolerans]GGA78913.1 aminopeptidase [Ornithinibacillus halotolerans]